MSYAKLFGGLLVVLLVLSSWYRLRTPGTDSNVVLSSDLQPLLQSSHGKSSTKQNTSSTPPRKKIFIWNTVCLKCGELSRQGTQWTRSCADRCEFLWDRAQLAEADAVFINNRLMVFEANQYPVHENERQIFVAYERESPIRRHVIKAHKKTPTNYFNATMSYVKDADIGYPYGSFVRRAEYIPEREHAEIVRKIVARKTKGIFKVFSHCKTESKRETLIQEMSEHIPIDLFGKCANVPCDAECYVKNVEQYRFYLAFENSICDDYVTEKFYNLTGKLVPIVMRASDYEGKMPPNSFIAVDQFDSFKSLASHLENLMHNDTEYSKYFEHIRHFEAGLSKGILCRVCNYAVTNPKPKVYDDIGKWFNGEKRCDKSFVPELLKRMTGNESYIV